MPSRLVLWGGPPGPQALPGRAPPVGSINPTKMHSSQCLVRGLAPPVVSGAGKTTKCVATAENPKKYDQPFKSLSDRSPRELLDVFGALSIDADAQVEALPRDITMRPLAARGKSASPSGIDNFRRSPRGPESPSARQQRGVGLPLASNLIFTRQLSSVPNGLLPRAARLAINKAYVIRQRRRKPYIAIFEAVTPGNRSLLQVW